MKETDCSKCCVCAFKEDLCNEDFCEKYYREGNTEDFEKLLPHWIPCSERLPEEDACYLVTTSGTNNDIIDIAYYTEGIWHKASRIKAWMPLPEPYREEGDS